MIIALQFVNKPEDVEAIFESESFDELGVENCYQCVDRIWAMAFANNELGKYNKTIDLLEPYLNVIQDRFFILPALRAYVNTGKKAKVDELLQKLNFQSIDRYDWLYLNLYTARLFNLQGQKDKAIPYLDTILENKNQEEYNFIIAQAYLEKGDFVKAEKIYSELNTLEPNNFHVLVGLASSYYRNGKIEESNEIIRQLNSLRAPYQYGEVDYRLAQIYAYRNEVDDMFESLLKSIASGHRYNDEKYKNSSVFADYLDSEKWNNILTYWH